MGLWLSCVNMTWLSQYSWGCSVCSVSTTLLHLISRMPYRHQGWKAYNGFMYRLHVGFSLRPFSRALYTAVFMFQIWKSLFHLSKKGWGLSQVVLHISIDDVAAGKDISHIFQRDNCWEVISLMVRLEGFQGHRYTTEILLINKKQRQIPGVHL